MIYNEAFKVGDKYKGLANGIAFSVVGLMPPGWYTTQSGVQYKVSRPYVVFLCENDGRPYEVALETAKRLQLQEI